MTLTAPDQQTTADSGSPTGQELLDLQRAAYRANPIPDLATRLEWLDRVEAMLAAHADEFAEALDRDFGTRPQTLSVATEIVGVMPELASMRKNLAGWMRTKKLNPVTGRASIAGRLRRDPLGVVGVIGAWNFPVQLTVLPAATALAAGNRVVIRPSELTPATAQALADAVAKWFEPEVLAVVIDEVTSGPEFSRLKFDHLFFTGSPKVGALVAQAAAANLVPHTLELGGKNPTIVHSEADVAKAAAQIARARLINGGQVCLCPDYVWVPNTVKDQFIDAVLETWRTIVPTIRTNPEYTSIVNDANFQRVTGLIDDAVAHGAVRRDAAPAGEQLPDAASRKIAPTVLTGVDESMAIDSEEVFGPVLAVYGYD
ncbi:MAG: aldehyde dehydrogenase family protein, partial [Nocardioides sp.]|uniref:aldehyde dehydrogenase family protein n=1 Tax=Nocardioides sp. TaxID=35761 RepID=UPI003F04E917